MQNQPSWNNTKPQYNIDPKKTPIIMSVISNLCLQEALALYNRNGSLKHMISKIRRDPSAFERYHHNRDLVALVNLFADSIRDLPRGWETKFDRSGKVNVLFLA